MTKRSPKNNTTLNIERWNTKVQEIIIELLEKKIDICAGAKTKRK